jgi:hypothetical protein
MRLICPKCKHEHKESDKKEMNLSGAYIHIKPKLIKENVGYQFGALASQLKSLRWMNIAKEQLKAGKSGELEQQRFFDNSVRGLPFQSKTKDIFRENALKDKEYTGDIKDEDIKYTLMSIDTQDESFYYVIRAFDHNNNSFICKHGHARHEQDLLEAWGTKYYNKFPLAGIIDEGGHRKKDVVDFEESLKGMFRYKGNSKISARFKISAEDKKLILANPKIYQAELLYYMYIGTKKDNYQWYINNKVNSDYIEQLTSMKPDNERKLGHYYENYTSNGNDHYFDCEKMILTLREFVEKKKAKGKSGIKSTNYNRS